MPAVVTEADLADLLALMTTPEEWIDYSLDT
jgi:hypothetical protein